ncbi:hypothetical protein Tco_1438789 [Tanacetum coccineum]
MLRVFPFILTGAAKRWVDRSAPRTINTWDLLKKAFIQRYCPPSKTIKQLEDIHIFKQKGDESLYQAWERYNDLLYKCPHRPPGYYTNTDNRPSYGERRKSSEELLAKHQKESTRRSTEIEIEQLTEELHSRNIKFEQAKVVIVEHEGPCSPKKLNNLHGISFLSDSQEENTNDQLPMKESNTGHFMLSCTIGNFKFYALADLGASVNVLPRNIFEYLELTNLSKTEMLVEMADIRKKAPFRIVRDILVKIDKFLFPFDFIILDQTPNSTINLGRPFLATVHAQISVFEKEISVGICDKMVTFNMNRNDHNFAPTEGIFMLNLIKTNEPITKRLKISEDTATTHFCKPIIQECDMDFKAWPSCSPFRNKSDGGMEFMGSMSLVKDSIWSKRYSEWCNENSHDQKPRPKDCTFKEWVKFKNRHLDISKSVRKDLFRLWVIDQFTEALDPNKNPLERCLDEYKWDEEKTKLGNKDYNPPMVHTETYEVTKYKLNSGCSFICVSGKNNETLSLGRKNGSRFRKMIMEEMEEVLENDGEDSDDET